MQDPKPCNCPGLEQNVIVHPGQDEIIHIFDYSKDRCQLSINLQFNIVSDHMFDEITISLVSSKRGIINRQVTTGAIDIIIQDKLRVKKDEQVWISIFCKNAEHLVSVNNATKLRY